MKQIKEVRDSGYSYVAAILAPVTVEMGVLIVLAVVTLGPAYALLQIEWTSFGVAVGLVAAMLFVIESYTGVCAFAPSTSVGTAYWMLGVTAMFFPLFTLEKNVVWPFRIFAAVTPLRYFSNSYFYAVLSDETFSGATADPSASNGFSCGNKWTQCLGSEGLDVLNSTIDIGFMPERTAENQIGHDVGIMVAWIVAFKLVALLLMRAAVQPALPGPPQKNKILQGETAMLVKAKRNKPDIGDKGAGTTVFDFRKISYSIKAKGSVIKALDSVSGSVEAGRMLAVIGPSGAGKTTLLNVLRLKPGPGTASGAITLNGVPFSGALAKEHSAAVEQGTSVWPMLTAREQLTYTFELVQPALSKEARGDLVDDMLEGFGLLEVQNTKAGSGLSGGELRRLAVATGLAKRPSLLFLDEPTTGLDSAAAAGVMDVVSQLATMANTAVICVIHQPSEAIYSKFDKVRPAARTSRALPCPPPHTARPPPRGRPCVHTFHTFHMLARSCGRLILTPPTPPLPALYPTRRSCSSLAGAPPTAGPRTASSPTSRRLAGPFPWA